MFKVKYSILIANILCLYSVQSVSTLSASLLVVRVIAIVTGILLLTSVFAIAIIALASQASVRQNSIITNVNEMKHHTEINTTGFETEVNILMLIANLCTT